MTIKITVDTREQNPYKFGNHDCHIVREKLDIGDYSLTGFHDYISIERKNLDDLIGCFYGPNRKRFEKELARSRTLKHFFVIVEAPLANIISGNYKSRMNSNAAVQSIMTFMIRYNCLFIFTFRLY